MPSEFPGNHVTLMPAIRQRVILRRSSVSICEQLRFIAVRRGGLGRARRVPGKAPKTIKVRNR